VIIAQCVTLTAFGAEKSVKGKTASISWKISDNTLTISPRSGVQDTGDWKISVRAEEGNWYWYNEVFPWEEYGKKIEKVIVKKGVKTIPDEAFKGFKKLKTVQLPNTVTAIGDSAFSSCAALTSVNLPDSITSISSGAFASCTSLKKITLPKYLTFINREMFSGCKKLKTVILPQKLETISYGAFDGCRSLTELRLPAGLTTLNASFKDCENLRSVTIPNSLKSDYSNLFNLEYTAVHDLYSADFVFADETLVTLEKNYAITLSAVSTSYGALRWESLNPDVAAVNGIGVVTAKSAGTAQIRAYINSDLYVMFRIDVISHTTGIRIKNAPEYISVGENFYLEIKLTPSDATDPVEYSVDGSKARVNRDGQLSGIKKGTFKLTVKSGSAVKTYTVKVEDPKISVTEKTMQAGYGNTLKLKGTKREVKWVSSNPSSVKVDEKSGKIAAVKSGYSCVIAQVGQMRYYCDITVMSPLEMKIDSFKQKYPEGYYWNNNTPSKDYPEVSEFPCTDHLTKQYSKCKGQCAGFAYLLSNEVFGKNAPVYKLTDPANAKVGDYIRYGNHSVFITRVIKKGDITGYDKAVGLNITAESNYWLVAHCNYDYQCGILWGTEMYPDNITADSFSRYK